MASKSTYTQHYSNFVGADMSSDPRVVSRNRLSYCVNMWRDYESEQGAAVETFPGFRLVAPLNAQTHGMYNFRSKSGKDYVVVHAGSDLYAFETESLANGDHIKSPTPILEGKLADKDSTGFLFNNNLYILDGEHFIVVSDVVDEVATVITANEIEGYIPTTYFDGKPYEQRNMLREYAYEVFLHQQYLTLTSDYNASGYLSKHVVNGYVSIYGINNNYNSNTILLNNKSADVYIIDNAFKDHKSIKKIDIMCSNVCDFGMYSFKNCDKLEYVHITLFGNDPEVSIGSGAFENCPFLATHTFVITAKSAPKITGKTDGLLIQTQISDLLDVHDPLLGFDNYVVPTEFAISVEDLTDHDENSYSDAVEYIAESSEKIVNGISIKTLDKIYFRSESLKSYVDEQKKIKTTFLFKLHPNHFSTIENVSSFLDGNPDYRQTGVEAINGCTKSAVFDGRIFLTGNPALPNTVFYSHRNLTGANDPTYFGAYNYFNDGVGNTPNVELLATPSMLMVLKNNTVQDGSVYYHVGANNTDEYSMNLLPRIYPATTGAAGLGSAGKTGAGVTCVNFLDDPVFLSDRGLEAVGKETVNLERTLSHRSANVDRLLIKEDLSHASLAEWKGYLVICCQGNMYLADSRYLTQHADGSYQYEWYYLEGLGTYKKYNPRFRYLTDWMGIGDYKYGDKTIKNIFKLRDIRYIQRYGDLDPSTSAIVKDTTAQDVAGESFTVYYFEEDDAKYLVQQVDEEKYGKSEDFCPAVRVLSIGGRLYFGTTNGDVCCVNTDKRDPDTGRIGRDYYTFNGVAYESGCATRLDDCDKKSVAKSTVCGTSFAVMKPMEGSKCNVNISLNGRDWRFLCVGQAFGSSFDFGNFDFTNLSFTENETNFVNLPELTRNWINKQYYFYSDGFKEPFGLYELSYIYNIKGKIRRM